MRDGLEEVRRLAEDVEHKCEDAARDHEVEAREEAFAGPAAEVLPHLPVNLVLVQVVLPAHVHVALVRAVLAAAPVRQPRGPPVIVEHQERLLFAR